AGRALRHRPARPGHAPGLAALRRGRGRQAGGHRGRPARGRAGGADAVRGHRLGHPGAGAGGLGAWHRRLRCGAGGSRLRRRRVAGEHRAAGLAHRVPRLASGGRPPAGAAAPDRGRPRRREGAPGRGPLGSADAMSLEFPAGEGWSAWPAPAKLILFLRITGRRPDGYHSLQTVFRILDWGDTVHIRLRDDGRIRRVGTSVPGVDEDRDLMVRAAKLLQKEANVAKGADIAVEKRIPAGGGFGGGSSDAATVLRALDLLWGCRLGEDRLAGLGLSLGADVPVFVRGRNAWAEGVGELLTPLDLPGAWYVLASPGVHVPTAVLFQA